jgi:3-dehydroquinate synthase class II
MNLISTIIIIGMKNAKKFLRENLTESKAVAARIFNVNARSLSAFIQRGSGAKNESHNESTRYD